jgi:hypothetical protein
MKYFSILFSLLLIGQTRAQETDPLYFNRLSEDFLKSVLERKSTDNFREELADLSMESLANSLDDDIKRIAFWVNIYNAYVQHFLQRDPAQYENKHRFFSSKQILIMGRMLSLDQIEHGLLRRSQWKFGLGNIRRVFVKRYEKELRVEKPDFRVHFVLNCGARSCPPIVILRPDLLEERLTKNTSHFLQQTTFYEKHENKVMVTPIFLWFRGDFGNKKGIRKILVQHQLIPTGSKPRLKPLPYDWTVDLENWIIEEN